RQAEESDRQNREIVNKLYTLVSEETLLNEPGMQPLRRKLLEAALEHYLGFVRRRGGDPKLRVEFAAAYQRVCFITRAIGSKADARTACEKALEIWKQLVRENPSDPRSRKDLEESYHSLGDLDLDTGHPHEALRSFEETLALREQLAQENPADAQSQQEL